MVGHCVDVAAQPGRPSLLVGTVTGEAIPLLSIAVLLAWSAVAIGLAVLAYRRDEGQRFR